MTAANPVAVDLCKHFRRKERGGPKIVCKYCTCEIHPAPLKGINERRKQHLVECKKYDYNESITTALRDYVALQTFPPYDDSHSGLSKIVQALMVLM